MGGGRLGGGTRLIIRIHCWITALLVVQFHLVLQKCIHIMGNDPC